MVLQERIELSTSPLPRECSTTELLQRRLLRRGMAAQPESCKTIALARRRCKPIALLLGGFQIAFQPGRLPA